MVLACYEGRVRWDDCPTSGSVDVLIIRPKPLKDTLNLHLEQLDRGPVSPPTRRAAHCVSRACRYHEWFAAKDADLTTPIS